VLAGAQLQAVVSRLSFPATRAAQDGVELPKVSQTRVYQLLGVLVEKGMVRQDGTRYGLAGQ
jgi:DNA-binding IclR family transcriptional regulator